MKIKSRSYEKNKKNQMYDEEFVILGVNAAGLDSKLVIFENALKKLICPRGKTNLCRKYKKRISSQFPVV